MRLEPLGKIPLRQISRCHGDKRLRSIGLAGCHTQINSCTVREQIPTLLDRGSPRDHHAPRATHAALLQSPTAKGVATSM